MRMCEGLAIGINLLPITNAFLAMQLIEECQRLIACFSLLDKNSELNQYSLRIEKLNFQTSSSNSDEHKTQAIGKVIPIKAASLNDLDSLEMKHKYQYESMIYSQSPQPAIKRSQLTSKTVINVKAGDLSHDPNILPSLPNTNQGIFSDLLNLQFAPSAPSLVSSNSLINSNSKNLEYINKKSESEHFPQAVHSIPQSSQFAVQSSNTEYPIINKDQNLNLNVNIAPSAPSSVPSDSLINQSNVYNKSLYHSTLNNGAQKIIKNSNNLAISQVHRKNIQPEPVKIEQISAGRKAPPLKLENSSHGRYKSFDSKIVANIINASTTIIKPKNQFSIDNRWILNPKEIKMGSVLGNGTSCTVYKGEYKRTHVAVKSMRESYSGQNIAQEFQREVSAMLSLRHPNLVLFMGAIIEPQMMIISEFCAGGSLYKLLHEKKNIMLH